MSCQSAPRALPVKKMIKITRCRHFSDFFDANSLLGDIDDGQLTFLAEANLQKNIKTWQSEH